MGDGPFIELSYAGRNIFVLGDDGNHIHVPYSPESDFALRLGDYLSREGFSILENKGYGYLAFLRDRGVVLMYHSKEEGSTLVHTLQLWEVEKDDLIFEESREEIYLKGDSDSIAYIRLEEKLGSTSPAMIKAEGREDLVMLLFDILSNVRSL